MTTTTTVVKPQESAGQETTLAKKEARPVARQMEILLPKVEDLLPPDIRYNQFRAALYLELSGRPQLAQCVPESLRDSVLYAANYGLLPGRDCHFLPFKQKRYGGQLGATCVTNYFGVILTMERSGKIRRAFAHPVHDGDEWSFDMFADRPIHRPAITLGKKRGKELFYYGAVMFKDGTCTFEVMTLEELQAIRNSAPAHESGPWKENTVMMNRKSAIKRVAKYVKLTPKVQQLVEEDDLRELEDIPPERHAQNLSDLFGDMDHARTFEWEVRTERRSTGKFETSSSKETTGTQEGGAQNLGAPRSLKNDTRDSDEWNTLRHYRDDARLPVILLEQIQTALSETEPATDSEAEQLAQAILSTLDHLDE